MNRSQVKLAALVALPVAVVCALLGAVAVGAWDEEPETVTTVVPTDAGRGAAEAGPAVVAIEADDRPLTDAELDRASSAGLRIVGGGTVTDVDRSDDLGEAYEVEVMTETGEADVALDERFRRVPNLRYDD
jgi:hypothetical protein